MPAKLIRKVISRLTGSKKVSVIIPSFNRYKFLLNAIRSVENQTYKNTEVIVINDGSTEKEYYEEQFKNIRVFHCEVNSKKIFGFANLNYVRNIGINHATGDYIAFLDDDDIWLPNKLQMQLDKMKEFNCPMACSDGYLGKGEYDSQEDYKLYNAEHYYKTILDIYRLRGVEHYFENGDYPDIWTRDFIKIHNCITTCSVILDKNIVDKAGELPESTPPGEDYDYWLRLLEIDNFVYVKEPCFYCDKGHGHGRNY